jgi:hypothetical protein
VGVDVDGEAKRWTVHLNIPEPVVGLTLEVPVSFQFQSSLPEDMGITQDQERVLVPKAEGKVHLIFEEAN